MYPWLIWAFDRRYGGANAEQFEQIFRRADCLLTLISERHSRCTDQRTEVHAAEMIGRQKLVPALAQWSSSSRLSTYATRENTVARYFQNPLGGLGQYYLGTLRELRVLDVGERGWISYTQERGQPLAEAVDRYVDGDLFFATLEFDRVPPRRLDELSTFCFCQVPASRDEHARLTELLLHVSPFGDLGSEQRRLSLGLALAMVQASQACAPMRMDLERFQSVVYGRSFGSGRAWNIPSRLDASASGWALYVRNDLLSIAVQSVFALALKQMVLTGARCANGQDVSKWFQGTRLVRKVAKALGGETFAAARKRLAAVLAPIDRIDLPEHEWAYSRAILERYTESEDESADEAVMTYALKLLAALATRSHEGDAYAASPFAGEFLDDYPVNLQTFSDVAHGEWTRLTIAELLGWLADKWGIETHLRIALRKLRSNPQSTFRVRPTERGLEVMERIPKPTRTNPRMQRGLQILRDLGAIEDGAGGSTLTSFGQRKLREIADEQ
jgi:hypothetical protein